MRYLLVLRIPYASCNLPYRGRYIQHRMYGRSIAHDVGAPYLIENIAPLKAGGGIEIDFAGPPVGHAYRESVDLLLVAVVTLAACGADYPYLLGRQFCMTDHLADKCHAVHEKMQVEIDLLCYGIFAQSNDSGQRAGFFSQPYLHRLGMRSYNLYLWDSL